jgi:hypothetical protein
MLSGLPFYVWEVPGKPISIQLHFDVIDRVCPDILRGFGALKRRGAEVGGILLGKTQNGPRPKVLVEDFVTVPTEYLTGPSYNLSPNDLVAFEAALERCKSGALAVVGFYRSHTRDELYMDDADLELARRYFSQPGSVFLLVKPYASRPCVGGFFFWEDGEIYREATYQQFPFERRGLGGGEPRLPAPPPAAKPQAEGFAPLPPYTPEVEPEPPPVRPAEEPWPQAPATASSSLSILAAPEAPARPSSKLPWRWLLVPGFLVLAGVTGFVAYRNLDSAKASAVMTAADPALPLKLSVSERKSQLDVTWDRNAQAVTRANRGVLSISDGTKRRDLELSGTQLRNGRVLYSRLSGDVNLRLEVFPVGQPSVVESIRIISTEAPPADPPKPVTAQRPATPSRPKATPLPASRSVVVDVAPKPAPEEELARPERRR